MFPVGINNFSEIFFGYGIFVLIAVSVVSALLALLSSYKPLLSFQQSGYDLHRYYRWLNAKETKFKDRLMLLSLMCLFSFAVLNAVLMPVLSAKTVTYVGFVALILFSVLFIKTEKGVAVKIPLKRTKRFIRLEAVCFLTVFAVVFGLSVLFNFVCYSIGNETLAVFRYLPFALLPLLFPHFVALSAIIVLPFENAVKKRYILKATSVIKSDSAVKIAITGSFGKTGVKEILTELLSTKYKTLSTPKSFNTPMGVALSAKKLENQERFVVEMGARKSGDIRELCKMVAPSVGVLIGVNSQHLESFGTLENIKNTKYELFENLSAGGKGFFSSDNCLSVELYKKFGGEKYLAGISEEKNGDIENLVSATDIISSVEGTGFTLLIKGENPVKCKTLLLGKHNVSNICLAVAVAYKDGVSVESMVKAIENLKPAEHRLQILKSSGNATVIDDSYNSSEDGYKASLEVLATVSGRKTVITPGLVELGERENEVNYQFGKALSKVADRVVIVGNHNKESLFSGLTESGFDKEKVIFARTLYDGVNAIKPLSENDTVLFENDLPDNYS